MIRSRWIIGLGLGAILVGMASGLGPPESATAKMDTAKVADTIVNQSANIRVNDLVLIEGGVRDLKLLEDIAIDVRKLGAHPVITIRSDRLTRMMFSEVDPRFDAQEPTFALRLGEFVDAMITVAYEEKPDLLADVPAKRLTARQKAFQPIYEKMLERGVVQIHLGNGLYPTKTLAGQFDISYDELSKIFWDGVNVDYNRLQTLGAQVKSTLASGREVKITAPNGTDLTLSIAQRPIFVSNGVVNSEVRYARGPACQSWLPAGEVYLAPVPGTAEGTFIADTFFFEGKRIDGLKLVFIKGKLTSMTAKSDISFLKKRYEAAPPGRDVFAALDIGINPRVKTPAGSRFVSWMGAGTISVGFGGNTWAGGENEVPFDLFAHLAGGTLTVDGKPIVERGHLMQR